MTGAVSEEKTFEVPARGVVYMGAYDYKVERPVGIVRSGKFSLAPSAAMSEKEVLERVLERLKGTVWEEQVRSRLSGL